MGVAFAPRNAALRRCASKADRPRATRASRETLESPALRGVAAADSRGAAGVWMSPDPLLCWPSSTPSAAASFVASRWHASRAVQAAASARSHRSMSCCRSAASSAVRLAPSQSAAPTAARRSSSSPPSTANPAEEGAAGGVGCGPRDAEDEAAAGVAAGPAPGGGSRTRSRKEVIHPPPSPPPPLEDEPPPAALSLPALAASSCDRSSAFSFSSSSARRAAASASSSRLEEVEEGGGNGGAGAGAGAGVGAAAEEEEVEVDGGFEGGGCVIGSGGAKEGVAAAVAVAPRGSREGRGLNVLEEELQPPTLSDGGLATAAGGGGGGVGATAGAVAGGGGSGVAKVGAATCPHRRLARVRVWQRGRRGSGGGGGGATDGVAAGGGEPTVAGALLGGRAHETTRPGVTRGVKATDPGVREGGGGIDVRTGGASFSFSSCCRLLLKSGDDAVACSIAWTDCRHAARCREPRRRAGGMVVDILLLRCWWWLICCCGCGWLTYFMPGVTRRFGRPRRRLSLQHARTEKTGNRELTLSYLI